MTSSDEYLSIDTPENVVFGYEVAGIGSRFLAALVDTILIVVLLLIVNLTLLFLIRTLPGAGLGRANGFFNWLTALFGLIGFAFFWGYYIFFEMNWNGQSPGKRWVGLRVMRIDGTPITLTESLIRNLVRLVDFLPISYGIGVVTMFINEQARRLGDLAAGTVVVHDRATVTLDSLAAASASSAASRAAPAVTTELPIEHLTESDLRMAEDFLRRRTELSNRSAMAIRLIEILYERMELPSPGASSWEAEKLLAEIVAAGRNQSKL